MFVVLEQNVVARLVLLDEIAFQNQRFGFCFRGQKLDITDFIQKHPGSGMKSPRTLKIRTYTISQDLGLAYIKNFRPGILHDINSG